mgnify:FL=1|jgi:hypothetical protein|tara:strand:+ start:1034 stop:1234 length:201 start_codon:yes stop_codon:yes gene_type:complete
MKNPSINKILDIVRSHLHEDVPTNNIGGGKIAGSVEAGDDPPVRLKKKKKYIYMKGVRKMWKPDNG